MSWGASQSALYSDYSENIRKHSTFSHLQALEQKPVLAWEWEARSNNEKTKQFLSTAILKQTGGHIARKLQEKQKEGRL